LRRVPAFVALYQWLRRGRILRERYMFATLALLAIALGIAAKIISQWWFPPSAIVLAVLGGGLVLRVKALSWLLGVVAVVLVYDWFALGQAKVGPGVLITVVITSMLALMLSKTRQQLGVQGLRGEYMLLELRDRLNRQGQIPALTGGWETKVELVQAGGSSFGGDFVVSCRHASPTGDKDLLEVALVDVSGKGIDAGTRALLLSGAFGGLLGSVPREEFLPACNAYMRRGAASEGFVTAVHLSLDLASGEYVVSSAGHPPAVHYDGAAGRWRLTQAHGIVLGVLPDLHGAATQSERGVLQRGDALMLYTDGLVEAPGRDIDAGTDRLLGEAERMLTTGFRTGAPALVAAMQREIGGSDDCALVLLWRT
jgi:hypothetical protein